MKKLAKAPLVKPPEPRYLTLTDREQVKASLLGLFTTINDPMSVQPQRRAAVERFVDLILNCAAKERAGGAG